MRAGQSLRAEGEVEAEKGKMGELKMVILSSFMICLSVYLSTGLSGC